MKKKRVTPSRDPAVIALHRVMTARTDAQYDAAITELETCPALTAQGVRAKRSASENITFGTMSSLAELDVSNIFAFIAKIRSVKPVEFAVRLGESPNAGSVSMHFEGSSWKLSSITLPPKILSSIVDRLPSR